MTGATTDLQVRRLRAEDLDGLLRLYAQLHPNDAPLPVRAEVEALWGRILDDPAQCYLGGVLDGRLVSACHATVIPNLTRGCQPYAVIENVVTDAAHRRRGFGGRVMRALIDHCHAAGCYKIILTSAMHRTEQHGFERTRKQAFVITSE